MAKRGFEPKAICDSAITNAASTASDQGMVIDIGMAVGGQERREQHRQNPASNWLRGTNAARLGDRRINPSIDMFSGGTYSAPQGIDYNKFEVITNNLNMTPSARSTDAMLDSKLQETLANVAAESVKAGAVADHLAQLREMCKDSHDRFPGWIKSCGYMLKLFTIIYPNMYPEGVIDNLCKELTSPRASIAVLEKHGCPDGRAIVQKIITGEHPPSEEFVANADVTFMMDSIGSFNIPGSSSDPDEMYANGFPGFKAEKGMSYEKFLGNMAKGFYPADVEELRNGFSELNWNPDRYVSAHPTVKHTSDYKHERHGVYFHEKYYEKWPYGQKAPHGNFPTRCASVVRVRKENGSGILDFRAWTMDFRARIVEQLKNGERMCTHRTCVVGWFGNDFIKKTSGHTYVIPTAAFDSDIKYFIEDLLLELEMTFDKFCFVTGTTSEFHFHRKVDSYDYLVNRSIDFIREKGVMVFTMTDALNACKFKDCWHLANTASNAVRLAGAMAAAAKIMSWLCHSTDACLDRWYFAVNVIIESGNLQFRAENTDEVVLELSDAAPDATESIEDEIYHRFLGGPVTKICQKFVRDIFKESSIKRTKEIANSGEADGDQVEVDMLEDEAFPMPPEELLTGVWGQQPSVSQDDNGSAEVNNGEERPQVRPPMEEGRSPWRLSLRKQLINHSMCLVLTQRNSQRFPSRASQLGRHVDRSLRHLVVSISLTLRALLIPGCWRKAKS